MAKSLKEQLMEAGFRSNKMENHRESAKGRERKQAEKHQTTRNFCEHCSLIHPDVEKYKHNMPTTEAVWICLACADKLMIEDRFRVTEQSDMCKRGMFRRYFGATKDFSKDGPGPQRKPRDRDGNRDHKGNRGARANGKPPHNKNGQGRRDRNEN